MTITCVFLTNCSLASIHKEPNSIAYGVSEWKIYKFRQGWVIEIIYPFDKAKNGETVNANGVNFAISSMSLFSHIHFRQKMSLCFGICLASFCNLSNYFPCNLISLFHALCLPNNIIIYWLIRLVPSQRLSTYRMQNNVWPISELKRNSGLYSFTSIAKQNSVGYSVSIS